MELIRTRSEWRALLESWRRGGGSVGLVPTMGALHEGHLSLLRAAAARCDRVAMTVFVNPLQFGHEADLEAYPRDLGADLAHAEHEGVAGVFAPDVADMYPNGPPATRIVPGELSSVLEGRSRPGHFEGVALVVTKLFSLSGPVSAFFGEKDFQQLAVVRQLVGDLDLAVEIVGCPTVREPDGLALSSRNRRLSPSERRHATVLYRALVAGRAVLAAGGPPLEAEARMASFLAQEPLVRPDYAVAVDPETFEAPAGGEVANPERDGRLRLLVAAEVGPVRLIDNLAAVP